MKKKILAITLALCLVFAMTSVAFAANTVIESSNNGSAPVKLVIEESASEPPAGGGDEPIIVSPDALSFEISEKVLITANNQGVSVDDFQVINKSTSAAVVIDKLSLADAGTAGWTKAAYDTETFEGYAVGAKKYALRAKIDGETYHDLFNDWINVEKELSADGGEATVQFQALLTQVTAAVSEVEIGSLTVTLA